MRHRCKQAQETTGHPVAQLLSSLSARRTQLSSTVNAVLGGAQAGRQRTNVHVNGRKQTFNVKCWNFFGEGKVV